MKIQKKNEERPLPSPREIAKETPFSGEEIQKVLHFRQTIQNILERKDERLLLIIGPCSIHCVEQAVAYAKSLQQLTPQISKLFYPIMRVYYEKPRSSLGWQGLLNDPFLDGSHEILQGLGITRKLLKEITALDLPIAAEFVNPLMISYFDELISWGSIGARTATSQIHRQLASGLSMPIGIKNDVFGQISSALHALIVASHSQTYISLNSEGRATIKKSSGNPLAHLVLRGGTEGTNYNQKHVEQSLLALERLSLPSRVIIDCNHGNSGKNHHEQIRVFQDVLRQFLNGNRKIVGLMLESNLEEGQQLISENPLARQWGISITDPCLGWRQTKELLLDFV